MKPLNLKIEACYNGLIVECDGWDAKVVASDERQLFCVMRAFTKAIAHDANSKELKELLDEALAE